MSARPTVAAFGNARADTVRVRVRELPLTEPAVTGSCHFGNSPEWTDGVFESSLGCAIRALRRSAGAPERAAPAIDPVDLDLNLRILALPTRCLIRFWYRRWNSTTVFASHQALLQSKFVKPQWIHVSLNC
jgi:hypothetical protein